MTDVGVRCEKKKPVAIDIDGRAILSDGIC